MSPAKAPMARSLSGRTRQSGTGPLQAGFSLIELILVIILISVVAAIAMPRLSGALLSGTDILASESRLMGDIRQARNLAMVCAGGSVTVASTGARQYQVSPQDCAVAGVQTRVLERNAQFNGSFSAEFLYPRGNLRVANPVTIVLQDGQTQRSLCIRPFSGRISRGAC